MKEQSHYAEPLQRVTEIVAKDTITSGQSKERQQVTQRSIFLKSASSPANTSPSSSPSTNQSDGDRMDIDHRVINTSPRGVEMWNGLLDLTIKDDHRGLNTDGELSNEGIVDEGINKSPGLITKAYMSKGKSVFTNDRARKLPRRRLIDSLVEQSQDQSMDEDSSEDSEDDSEQESPEDPLGPSKPESSMPGYLGLSSQSSNVSATASNQPSQNAGPRFTYSRQRSMLAEEDFMQQLEFDMPIQPPQATESKRSMGGQIPKLAPLQSFDEEEEDDDTATNKAVRSVHELRQAGANNRFLDEVEDLLERIGQPAGHPSSMRRGALLELATKMNDKAFSRQFRSNGLEQRLFLQLDQESDIISGFLIVVVLMTELSEAPIPHIVAQLRRQGITALLIRLLSFRESITHISKDRKSNMSKNSQSILAELHQLLIQMSLWDDWKPSYISPRIASLKCLELVVKQTRDAGESGDIFSREMISSLFGILQSGSDDSVWDLTKGNDAIDFYLALSTLECHSISSRKVEEEAIWIAEYLPIIAKTVEKSLAQPPDRFGPSQILILRLTLNVTNNNPNASDVFANGQLMATVGQAINYKFRKISKFLTEEEFSLIVDHLILLLGVMINFAEWSSNARERLNSLQDTEHDPMDTMIQLFVDYKEITSEASPTSSH